MEYRSKQKVMAMQWLGTKESLCDIKKCFDDLVILTCALLGDPIKYCHITILENGNNPSDIFFVVSKDFYIVREKFNGISKYSVYHPDAFTEAFEEL